MSDETATCMHCENLAFRACYRGDDRWICRRFNISLTAEEVDDFDAEQCDFFINLSE